MRCDSQAIYKSWDDSIQRTKAIYSILPPSRL
jgi:hypothetical protein